MAAPETVQEIWLLPGKSDVAPELSDSSFLHPESSDSAVKNMLIVKSLKFIVLKFMVNSRVGLKISFFYRMEQSIRALAS